MGILENFVKEELGGRQLVKSESFIFTYILVKAPASEESGSKETAIVNAFYTLDTLKVADKYCLLVQKVEDYLDSKNVKDVLFDVKQSDSLLMVTLLEKGYRIAQADGVRAVFSK